MIVVDAISALCAHQIKMDEWQIDCLISGSQKGFGVPPGLAFVALSDKAMKMQSRRARFYFDYNREQNQQNKGTTAWTPAITLIEKLKLSLEKIHEIGLSKLINHHQRQSHNKNKQRFAVQLYH